MNLVPTAATDDRCIRVTMIGDFPRSEAEIGGGVESVMLYSAQHLRRAAGIELSVVTLERWGREAKTRDFDGYRVHYVAPSAIRGPLRKHINTRRLTAAISATEPDIVHAHIAGHYSRAAIEAGAPMVLTLHGIRFLEANLRTGLIDRLYRRHVIRREERRDISSAGNIVSINPFIEETFGRQLQGNVTRIENPVADEFFEIADHDNGLGMLYAGRVTPRKDILTLLRGFSIVYREFPAATLKIAGAPDNPDPVGYFERVKQSVDELGLGDSVHFLGNLSEGELLREYGAATFFVLAAVLETAPMSIGEAMAAGRVVITTDAGGCRHMVEHGVSGMVVPVGDAERLGEAMLTCARSKDLRRSLGAAARRSAEQRFRAEAIAERTIALYRGILGGLN